MIEEVDGQRAEVGALVGVLLAVELDGAEGALGKVLGVESLRVHSLRCAVVRAAENEQRSPAELHVVEVERPREEGEVGHDHQQVRRLGQQIRIEERKRVRLGAEGRIATALRRQQVLMFVLFRTRLLLLRVLLIRLELESSLVRSEHVRLGLAKIVATPSGRLVEKRDLQMVAYAAYHTLCARPVALVYVLVQVEFGQDVLGDVLHVEAVQVDEQAPQVTRQREQEALEDDDEHDPLVVDDLALVVLDVVLVHLARVECAVHPAPVWTHEK